MQNALKVLSAPKKRMSSMEISNVTGKRHGDVMAWLDRDMAA